LLIDGSAQGGACIFGEDNNIVGDRLWCESFEDVG
jgi:hypothetical protein